MKYSIVFKQRLNTFGHSLHFKYPGPSPGYQCTAKPHGRDHRVWISVAQMIRGEHPIATEKSLSPPDSEQGAWGLSQPPLPSSPPPSPCCTSHIAPPSPLPEAAVGWATLLYHPNILTNFSGVSTMAKVDPSVLQKSLLLFQESSKGDNEKHLLW